MSAPLCPSNAESKWNSSKKETGKEVRDSEETEIEEAVLVIVTEVVIQIESQEADTAVVASEIEIEIVSSNESLELETKEATEEMEVALEVKESQERTIWDHSEEVINEESHNKPKANQSHYIINASTLGQFIYIPTNKFLVGILANYILIVNLYYYK